MRRCGFRRNLHEHVADAGERVFKRCLPGASVRRTLSRARLRARRFAQMLMRTAAVLTPLPLPQNSQFLPPTATVRMARPASVEVRDELAVERQVRAGPLREALELAGVGSDGATAKPHGSHRCPSPRSCCVTSRL